MTGRVVPGCLGLLCVAVALSGCRWDPLPRGQLDVQVAQMVGAGPGTHTVDLVAGRYTITTDSAPRECQVEMTLTKNGATRRDVRPGAIFMVQGDLDAGRYQLQVRPYRSPCAWVLFVVLNSLPPFSRDVVRAYKRPVPAAHTLRSDGSHDAEITETGYYRVQLSTTSPLPGACAYNLVASSAGYGHYDIESQTVRSSPPAVDETRSTNGDGGFLLAAGTWHFDAGTQCAWKVELRPTTGPLGGGARGFG